MNEQLYIQNLLNKKLTETRKRNPSYSLRSFAKKIGISPSALSEILSGKRRVSKNIVEKIAHNLGIDPSEKAHILKDFPNVLKRNSKNREITNDQWNQIKLSSEQFNLISDWAHFAILSLIKISDFKADPTWIAERIQITPTRAKKCLVRLFDLKLISVNESGSYSRTNSQITTIDDVVNTALQKAHIEDMEIAKEKLTCIDVKDRDFTSYTMAFDPEKMNEVKVLIRKFQDDLADLMKDSKTTQVYKLCNYLFPLTKLSQEIRQ